MPWTSDLVAKPWMCWIRKLIHAAYCRFGPKPPVGKPARDDDQSWICSLFPNLQTWSQTGPRSTSYNCITWTLGITDEWIFDEIIPDYETAKVEYFDNFYASYGWIVSNIGEREYKKRKIALYALDSNPNFCKHASLETHDCGWHESKIGSSIRIMHIHTEMEGGYYGNIVRYYEKEDITANLDLC